MKVFIVTKWPVDWDGWPKGNSQTMGGFKTRKNADLWANEVAPRPTLLDEQIGQLYSSKVEEWEVSK